MPVLDSLQVELGRPGPGPVLPRFFLTLARLLPFS